MIQTNQNQNKPIHAPSSYQILSLVVIQLLTTLIPAGVITGCSFLGFLFLPSELIRTKWILSATFITAISAMLAMGWGIIMLISDWFDHTLTYGVDKTLNFEACTPKTLVGIIANYNGIWIVGYLLHFVMYILVIWTIIDLFITQNTSHHMTWLPVLFLLLPLTVFVVMLTRYPWKIRTTRTLAAVKEMI